MSDLRDRAPATAIMEKLVSLLGTPELTQLPFGMVIPSADAISWLRGIRGELEMAAQLDHLGEEWTILHSVLVGSQGNDIDHIIVGPQGIFSINTKRLREREVLVKGDIFRVDGHKRNYLQKSDYEATRVEKVLRGAEIPVNVIPVIAISGAKSLRVLSKPAYGGRGIGVVSVKRVIRRIQKQPVRLTPAEVQNLVAVVSDSSRWTRSASTFTSAEVQAAYNRIDRGVTRWNIALMTLLLLSAAVTAVFEYNWISYVIF